MNFKQQLQARREAALACPETPEKPISELTEAELDQELEKTREELHRLKQETLDAGREAVEDANRRPRFLPNRRKKNWR